MSDSPLPLIWAKRGRDSWCRLLELDFRLIDTYGVYVIWDGGLPSRVLRVGHGDIASELRACCADRRLTAHLKDGPLFVTWAAAPAADAAGIHRYLEESLRPLIADSFAAGVSAIAVRAPF